MKKVLFVATVTRHINSFHIPYLKLFKENGYEVHVASYGEEEIKYCDKHYNIPFERNPLKIENIKAYKELKKIIDENNYEIIHCHTPVGGALTRLAAKKARKEGTRVIYTAHGFHFYKGAPIKNWLIFYPIEKYLSKYTDTLININKEDYDRAKRKFKKCKDIHYVHGVGLDTSRFDIEFKEEDLEKLRKEIGIQDDNIVLTYVAELNSNKNQILLIKTIEELIKQNDKYRLLLVGEGNKRKEYEQYIKENNLKKYIKLLGKRKDVPHILKITNIYVASSIREGLPVNIIEAMYMSLPIITTNNRGHRDLIDKKDIINGFDYNKFTNKILSIKLNHKENNYNCSIEKYKDINVIREMEKIYFNKIEDKGYYPLVSIIIPVYNGSNYLSEAIDSALNQTYKNIEIIVVNDGSNDNGKTEKICLSYGDKIKYIKKENGGSSSALNEGIKNMKGEWFSWLSHDDLYYPEKVQKQIEYINNKFNDIEAIHNNVFFGASELINKDGKLISKRSNKEIEKNANKINKIKDNSELIAEPTKNIFHGCTCLIHKKVFEEIGLFDENLRLLNDVDMWFRIYSNNYKINYIPEIIVKGRVHKNQISTSIGFSYHNIEQDMFWNRSLNWLLENKKEEYNLFYLFGKNAYEKTRYTEGKRSFDYYVKNNPKMDYKINILKVKLLIYSKTRNILKKIYLKVSK